MQSKITHEIGLIAASGRKATAGHEQEDHRTVDFVAGSEVESGLIFRGTKRPLIIELHVHFEFRSQIVPQYQACEQAVRSFTDKLITDLIIHVDRAEFLGELEGVIPRRTASFGLLRKS